MRRDDDLRRGESQPGPDGAAGRADQEYLHRLQRERQTRVAKALFALAILGILLAFIVSNSQSVTVHFVFFTRRPALIWVMFGCAILGGLIGYLIGRPGKQIHFRQKKEEEPKKG